mgnify:CR=1 FL=1
MRPIKGRGEVIQKGVILDQGGSTTKVLNRNTEVKLKVEEKLKREATWTSSIRTSEGNSRISSRSCTNNHLSLPSNLFSLNYYM